MFSRCSLCVKRSARNSRRCSSTLSPISPDLAPLLADPARAKDNLLERASVLPVETIDSIIRWETERREIDKRSRALQERRNSLAKDRGGPSDEQKTQAARIRKELDELSYRTQTLQKDLHAATLHLPSYSHPDTPLTEPRLIKHLGPTISSPDPPPESERDHLALTDLSAGGNGWLDFGAATLLAGRSWPLLQREAALLELALTQYAISIVLSKGFELVLPPDVVKREVAERCGFHPRDEGGAQQTYFLSDGTAGEEGSLALAGTAEIPLVGMSAGQTYAAKELPIKRVALGRAFRAEAGARGSESRGLYRVHQFSKVEMVVMCEQEHSEQHMESLRGIQEEILSSLGLSLRVLDMPRNELGASAYRKYDIEAWMPGRGRWGELSSASNCTDFQSRRLNIRYRPSTSTGKGKEKAKYVHTLNGTAAAIPRLIVALLENGAVLGAPGKKGRKALERIRLPKVLQRYWLGGDSAIIDWVPEGEGEPLRVE